MLERQLKAPVRHQPRVAIIDLHGEIDAEVRSNSQTREEDMVWLPR